jgi:hypothetical protein
MDRVKEAYTEKKKNAEGLLPPGALDGLWCTRQAIGRLVSIIGQLVLTIGQLVLTIVFYVHLGLALHDAFSRHTS